MKVLVSTQYRENYGAHQWNGEGVCPQQWKNKGGSYYTFPFPRYIEKVMKHDTIAGMRLINEYAHANTSIVKDDEFEQEFILDVRVLGDREYQEEVDELMQEAYQIIDCSKGE